MNNQTAVPCDVVMVTKPEDYTVGWICAIPTEYVVACELLDEEYLKDKAPRVDTTRDSNSYTFGRIHEHNVVVSCLPKGRYGTTSAAVVAERMLSSFSNIRFGLLVGIAGGAPSQKHDIRLGDVVVSSPTSTPGHSGVIQYDFGKAIENHDFEETGHLAPVPDVLLNALANINMQHMRKGHRISETVTNMINKNRRLQAQYNRPMSDKLYELASDNSEQLVIRQEREADEDNPVIHYGLIASANRLMKDRRARDALIAKYDVLCFEMEAAGLMNNFPCVVIRGICDYSDIYKNDEWQGYAAATAAAYAKELLEIIPGKEVEPVKPATGIYAICQQSPPIPFDNTDYIVATSNRPSIATSSSTDHKFNDFRSSTNHGIQAHTVYGGYHHHSYQNPAILREAETDGVAVNTAITQADLAIRQYYMSSGRLDIERLSGEKLSMENCYINLAIIDRSNQKEGKTPTLSLKARLRLDAEDVGKSIALQDLFEPRKLSDGNIVPRRIFIQGRAGIGKTTLCKKLVYGYTQGNLGTDLFDRLLWIPLRRLKSRQEYNWQDLIQDSHLLPNSTWKQIKEIYSDQFDKSEFINKTLLLFDGLDEISHRWKQGDDMYEFLETVISNSPNVIITSRPQSIYVGKFDLELETVGFSSTQIDTYLEMCIPQSEEITRIKSFLRERPMIQGLLRIPIQLDAFCCFWTSEIEREMDDLQESNTNKLQEYKPDSISTMTSLYESISFELCRKDMARLEAGRWAINQSRKFKNFEISKHFENDLKFLGELAFQGMVNGIAEYIPRHQDKIGSFASQTGLRLPVPYSPVLESMSFLRTSDAAQDQSKRNYHFIHLTFQEFFAAKHFVAHWQNGTPLICLQLSSHSRNQIQPFAFLQKEKYNPQYNIFWRFVSGLVLSCNQTDMTKPNGDKSIIDFFDQLHKKPIDLIGFTHYQLLMSCLNEVRPDNSNEVKQLREREEDVLRKRMIDQYKVNGQWQLGRQAEFPLSILASLLKNDQDFPLAVTLSILQERSFVDIETLNVVSDLIDDRFTADIQSQAIEVVFSNIQMGSRGTWIKTIEAVDKMLKHTNPLVVRAVLGVLNRQLFLPQEIINIVISVINNNILGSLINSNILGNVMAFNLNMMKLLENQPSLNRKVLNTLVTMLIDKNSNLDIKMGIGGILRKHSPSSPETVTTLRGLLQDSNPAVRISVAKALENHPSLSQEVNAVLIAALQDETPYIRGCTAQIMGDYTSPSRESINAFTVAIEYENGDSRISDVVARTSDQLLLQENVNTLPIAPKEAPKDETDNMLVCTIEVPDTQLCQEAVVSLLKELKYGDFDARISAAMALTNHPYLSRQAIIALLGALSDSHPRIARRAATTLGNISYLPQDVINSLVEMLKIFRLREYAIMVLKKHLPLPEGAITGLIEILGLNSYMIYNMLHQSNIYLKIITLDDRSWRKLWSYWLVKGFDNEICCYELEGSLYIWSRGELHTISTDPTRTRELLEVVLGPNHQAETHEITYDRIE